MSAEKQPLPPSYTEIYPTMEQLVGNTSDSSNTTNMGWQPSADTTPINQTVNIPQQPPAYGTQSQATAEILSRQRVGLYPIQLTPCPHCLRHEKTFITYDTTLKTHLFALILCVACCWCCIPIPYCTNNATKIANHFCENCKNYIGSYDRNPCKW